MVGKWRFPRSRYTGKRFMYFLFLMIMASFGSTFWKFLDFAMNSYQKSEALRTSSSDELMVHFYSDIYKRVTHQSRYFENEGCSLTNDIEKADVIITSLNKTPDLSKIQTNRQNGNRIWVYMSLQPPSLESTERDLESMARQENFGDLIEYTISYRSDADLQIKPITFTQKKKDKDQVQDIMQRVQNVPRRTAWMPSRCSYGPDSYLESLLNFLNIDIIGKCGTNHRMCKGQTLANITTGCSNWIQSNYFTMLVVDDAFCSDYMSPDVLTVIKMGLIPITISGYRNMREFPEGSVIYPMTDSPSDIKKQVEYIKEMKPKDLYSYFFSWKEDFRAGSGDYGREMCRRLKEMVKTRSPRTRSSFVSWAKDEFKCFPTWKALRAKRNQNNHISIFNKP